MNVVAAIAHVEFVAVVVTAIVIGRLCQRCGDCTSKIRAEGVISTSAAQMIAAVGVVVFAVAAVAAVVAEGHHTCIKSVGYPFTYCLLPIVPDFQLQIAKLCGQNISSRI